jgi:hypothetical protein
MKHRRLSLDYGETRHYCDNNRRFRRRAYKRARTRLARRFAREAIRESLG